MNTRMKSIGGSEVGAILGVDEYSSPYKVWLSKTGREDTSVDNKYTKAGLILEPAVAEFFEKETGYRIIKQSANQRTYYHPQFPFLSGTPDRRYIGKTIGQAILECKTTQVTYDEPPEKWFIQLQWYLGIVGMRSGALAWLERGLDFKFREYEYDNDFFEYLVEEVRKFWENHVLKDVPPDPISIEDINSIYKRHNEGLLIDATPEVLAVYEELKTVDAILKEAEKRKEELTGSLKMFMRDAEAIIHNARSLVTWKTSKSSMLFDRDKFKAEEPELYNKYLIEKEGSRRFLIK